MVCQCVPKQWSQSAIEGCPWQMTTIWAAVTRNHTLSKSNTVVMTFIRVLLAMKLVLLMKLHRSRLPESYLISFPSLSALIFQILRVSSLLFHAYHCFDQTGSFLIGLISIFRSITQKYLSHTNTSWQLIFFVLLS